MATSVQAAGCSETLGLPVQGPLTQHSIIVSLPSWRDNVDFVEKKKRVMDLLTAGYPRFWIHTSIRKLADICKQKFETSEECLLFPSKSFAIEYQTFIVNHPAFSGNPASVRVVQYAVCPEGSFAQTRPGAELHIVFYPADMLRTATQFWQNAGLGISSRFAEHCLSLLCAKDERNPKSLGEANHVPHTTTPSDATTRDQNIHAEEGHGQNSPLSSGALAKRAIRRRIAALLRTGNMHDDPQEPRADAQDADSVRDVTEDDVFLFHAGMVAIWTAHQLCLRARPPAKSVSFGFPYLDTLKVLEKWGPGADLFALGSDSDIDTLESFLVQESTRDPTKPPILALFAEHPSNPLLRSVDIPRLRALADKYDFLIVVDDTIGTSVNIDILPYVDIVTTSLSKIFSGAANAMGGSLVLNPKGRYYETLKSRLLDMYEDTYFDEDAIVMEYNSRDFDHRVRVIDENAQAICAYLRSCSAAGGGPSAILKEVFYPKYTTPDYYVKCKRPEGGYGGLFTLTFTSMAASVAFFDALPFHKGPSLGTNFTLACPYTILAFYRELEWAAEHGVEEGLVRISVGMEDRDWLIRSLDGALRAAEAAHACALEGA